MDFEQLVQNARTTAFAALKGEATQRSAIQAAWAAADANPNRRHLLASEVAWSTSFGRPGR